MERPDGLFALRAHPFGAALWAFSAAAALCLRLRRPVDFGGLMSLDVDRVGRTHPANVNEYGVRPGFREMRDPARFGVETSGWKGLLLRFAGDRTVTEV